MLVVWRRWNSFNLIWQDVGHLVVHKERSYVQSLIDTPDSKKASLAAEIDQVSYMFSHLVLAHRKLAKGYSPVQNIECLNGFRLLVKEPADGLLLFAGVSNDLGKSKSYSKII